MGIRITCLKICIQIKYNQNKTMLLNSCTLRLSLLKSVWLGIMPGKHHKYKEILYKIEHPKNI